MINIQVQYSDQLTCLHIRVLTHESTHAQKTHIHTSASTETRAMVYTVPVDRLFPQSIIQRDTNWKEEKRHKRERGISVQVGFFHLRSHRCAIPHYRRAAGGRIDQGRGEHAALHSYRFHVGDCGDVKGPQW